MDISSLPDETPAYVVGVGEVTLGVIRAKPVTVGVVDEATLRMWEEKATRNLDPLPPCGGTRSARKASTA